MTIDSLNMPCPTHYSQVCKLDDILQTDLIGAAAGSGTAPMKAD